MKYLVTFALEWPIECGSIEIVEESALNRLLSIIDNELPDVFEFEPQLNFSSDISREKFRKYLRWTIIRSEEELYYLNSLGLERVSSTFNVTELIEYFEEWYLNEDM